MKNLSTAFPRRAILRGILSALLVAGVPLLATTALAPALAQETQGTQQTQQVQDSFSDTLDVQAVDVEVLVTDRKGNPVPGLKAADFSLLVDGKEVPLEYFAEISEGAAVPPPAAAAGGSAVPPPPALADADQVGNNYLVFIDEFFTPPAMRNEAVRGLAREAATLRPQDRMAIVSFNGRKLTVLSPWIAPGEPLQKFLALLAEHKASFAATPFSITDLEPAANELLYAPRNRFDDSADDGSILDGVLNEKREAVYVDRSIEAASATLRSFAAVSGRKLLVLLSGGWNYEVHKEGKRTAKRNERLQPLIDTCNLLGYTIYPIHLAQNGPADVPRNATVVAGTGTGVGYSSGATGGLQQLGLVEVAEETGGKFLMPGNNKHLSRIAADTRSYYWLGFTHSGGGGDSGSHAVRVKVNRPGLEVRTRKSFVPLSRQARLGLDLERALLTRDTRGMGLLSVSLGTFTKVDGKTGELPITVRVPVEKLTLTEQGGRYLGKLELRIAALDDEGNRSEVPVLPIDIARDEAPKPGAVIRYDTRLRLRHTAQEVQLILYDTLGGKSFAERLRVQP